MRWLEIMKFETDRSTSVLLWGDDAWGLGISRMVLTTGVTLAFNRCFSFIQLFPTFVMLNFYNPIIEHTERLSAVIKVVGV